MAWKTGEDLARETRRVRPTNEFDSGTRSCFGCLDGVSLSSEPEFESRNRSSQAKVMQLEITRASHTGDIAHAAVKAPECLGFDSTLNQVRAG